MVADRLQRSNETSRQTFLPSETNLGRKKPARNISSVKNGLLELNARSAAAPKHTYSQLVSSTFATVVAITIA